MTRPTPSRHDETLRRRALLGMKRIATGLLLLMAIIFAVAFTLQDRYPWLQWLRAASEGGMVGALADWFAVTALFRRPLGLPIPHTAIIPAKKDEIGASLAQFVEENFLSGAIVREKLDSFGIARRVGFWCAEPTNAHRVARESAAVVHSAITLLDDSEVQRVMDTLVRRHVLAPYWGPSLGALVGSVVEAGHHRRLVDTVIEQAEGWLAANPQSFTRMASGRLPSWLPSAVSRLVDERLYREALIFVAAVREDQTHPFRLAIDGYLATLARDLASDPLLIARVEGLKSQVFDSPRVHELVSDFWEATKASLLGALDDPSSPLRASIESLVADVGRRLSSDERLADSLEAWVGSVAASVVDRYRGEIASIIDDTIGRWDPQETAEKLELQVGKDLQFIRINGTVVGSLAGLIIFTVAHALLAP
ncbi:DUF445 domain-containing protein [Rathayibacter toxicus]|uniref:DUF445 domain-containing protein n=1 Tax=Rathayibacter toxicus TaxID=145458 RepID=A0A2S5Y8Z6_9MICO|nr:DUF445 domain-containing protein [Rathayibacter toxicus]PPH24944.1 DUF445 domain-containing protein [Rathayibacter toxicus]PPH58868.1 DUF445 domain-containing protein [Rathayibacter toxicus]PPH60864.1 DUF445 domain-containing protein [Rathayibacter toxicus]PPH88684.1 DUF445 domain-containing protein [Rathayibacter toxicus]PPI16376.1 DUF445 domain-containing protein [Rathayibacter toxicus]